ncbi:cation:proton antiporter [Candidatus Woesearchaeota archaeon]|nr:cation:proton antiporter [Candidatus Woesearchaeota archaeon]
MATFIGDFGILLLIIVVISFFIKVLRQPIIFGYVLSGLLFSHVLSSGESGELIIAMSELGITFLLFLMGLELDVGSLRYLGKDIIFSIIPQSVIFFLLPFILSGFFDFNFIERIYVSILFMFSSTLLVAKWLEDTKETNTLHGKLIIGTLILQDFLAIIALTLLAVSREESKIALITSPLKGIVLILIAFILAKYLLNRILRFSSRYPELLFIVSLGVCFAFVEIAPLLGYSATIGAFIGGITLANTIYKNEVAGRLRPLIVFFNMLFFVGLGFQLDLNLGLDQVIFIGIMLIFALVLKPVVIYWTLRFRGYDLKTSFITGLHLAQLSEFGIIIIAGGILSQAIPPEIGSLAVILVIITMIASSYFIKYDDALFKLCEPYLRMVDTKIFPPKDIKSPALDPTCNMLFFGYYDLGPDLYNRIKEMGKNIMVIENDPENIGMLKRENIPYVYNSIHNPDFLENVDLQRIELAVSSLANVEDNKKIITRVKKSNPAAVVMVTAKNLKDSLELYNCHADYVLYPSYLNHRHVSVLLEDYTTDINKVLAKKVEDITRLRQIEQKRKEVNQDLNKLWEIDSFFADLSRKQKILQQKIEPQELVRKSYREIGKLWDIDGFFKHLLNKDDEEQEQPLNFPNTSSKKR